MKNKLNSFDHNKMNKRLNNYWRKEKLRKLNVIGSRVLLPFDEEGIVIDYINWKLDWFPFKVEITKGNFNFEGEIVEFKKEQIIFEEKELNKMFRI